MTPVGTRRISALARAAVIASVPIVVATTETVVPSPPASDGEGDGAVKLVIARPSVPVTSVRACNVPKSCGTKLPFLSGTSIDNLTVSPLITRPLGPIAITVIALWDEPSCVSRSGFAYTVIDVASSDGPINGGACVCLTVQADMSAVTTRRDRLL